MADKLKIAPEQAASNQQNFDTFWKKEQEKLEDMCRQMKGMPNFFFTVAPAEWKFQWHRGMQHWRQAEASRSDGQAIMTFAVAAPSEHLGRPSTTTHCKSRSPRAESQQAPHCGDSHQKLTPY
jgi:hypothetical protein